MGVACNSPLAFTTPKAAGLAGTAARTLQRALEGLYGSWFRREIEVMDYNGRNGLQQIVAMAYNRSSMYLQSFSPATPEQALDPENMRV